MRSLSILAIATLTALILGAAATTAQQAAPSTCGVETWSTEKMTYVTVPCAGAQEQSGQSAKAPDASKSPNAAKCGIETWSTDKMAYESTPCASTQ
jgi:hypothetical protein